MATFVRISALSWADLLATFAMYVMMNYLTNVWNLSTTHAAGIVNIWNGITPVLTIVFAFFVDSFVGDFDMLLLSSISYSIGLGLLSMSTPAVFGPCHHYKVECVGHTQKVLFYTALPLIAVGMAGHVVSLAPFLALQTRNENENENGNGNGNVNGNGKKDAAAKTENKNEKKDATAKTEIENEKKDGAKTENESKIFYQIPGVIMVLVVPIAGGIALPYIKPWSIRFGIPAIFSVVATLLFFTGFQDYERKKPAGSPLTTMLRVFVATARKFSQPVPDPKDLYNEDDAHSTGSLRCFDKAAIRLPAEQQSEKWKLCKVREVEDTKIIIRLIPMWLTFIVIGIVLSIGNTYFLEQANRMDLKLGSIKISIPIFLLFYMVTSNISAYIYKLWTMCLPNKKHAPPLGIATSMVFAVLCCITVAKVETRRLHRIRDHGLLDKPNNPIPMSIFALLPQFMLLAAVDGIANTSMDGFFRNQTPESMHKYLTYFTKGVLGLGRMASVLSVYVVGKVSEKNQKPNWFQYTLNWSRLDRYYWVLAGLSAANLVVYIIVAYFYKYKESPDDDGVEVEGGEMNQDFQEKNCCC